MKPPVARKIATADLVGRRISPDDSASLCGCCSSRSRSFWLRRARPGSWSWARPVVPDIRTTTQ